MDFDQEFHDDDDNCILFIEELKSDDLNIRINAASKIYNVAEILGPTRLKQEFIPHLMQIIEEKDNDDEFIIKLIEQLINIKSLLSNDIHLLLDPLKLLCSKEEPSIRDKAIESIIQISNNQNKDFFSNLFLNVVKQLAIWNNYSSKISACNLFSICYPMIKPHEQIEICKLYSELANDDTPMVRKTVANCIKNMVSVLNSDTIKNEIIPLFNILIKDDVDLVKINAIENSVYLIPYFTKREISDNLLTTLKNIDSEGKSWKIKFALAECLVGFIPQLDQEIIRKDIYPIYESMLKHQEQEVRSCVLVKLSDFYEYLSEDQLKYNLIPILSQLINDTSLHVRISLAKAIPELASSMNIIDLIKLVLPLIKSLFKDEITDVRISLIQNLKLFNKAIGIDNIKKYIIPMITSSCNNEINEKQWRFKLNLLEVLPDICIDIGFDIFKEELCNFCFSFLNDHIYAIREQTINNIEKLVKAFGYDNLKNIILHYMYNLINNTNYIFRITSISFFIKLYDHFDKITCDDLLNNIINKMGNDGIPNVRFNLIKLAINLKPKLNKHLLKKHFDELLEKLVYDKDSDVSYYAQLALEETT